MLIPMVLNRQTTQKPSQDSERNGEGQGGDEGQEEIKREIWRDCGLVRARVILPVWRKANGTSGFQCTYNVQDASRGATEITISFIEGYLKINLSSDESWNRTLCHTLSIDNALTYYFIDMFRVPHAWETIASGCVVSSE